MCESRFHRARIRNFVHQINHVVHHGPWKAVCGALLVMMVVTMPATPSQLVGYTVVTNTSGVSQTDESYIPITGEQILRLVVDIDREGEVYVGSDGKGMTAPEFINSHIKQTNDLAKLLNALKPTGQLNFLVVAPKDLTKKNVDRVIAYRFNLETEVYELFVGGKQVWTPVDPGDLYMAQRKGSWVLARAASSVPLSSSFDTYEAWNGNVWETVALSQEQVAKAVLEWMKIDLPKDQVLPNGFAYSGLRVGAGSDQVYKDVLMGDIPPGTLFQIGSGSSTVFALAVVVTGKTVPAGSNFLLPVSVVKDGQQFNLHLVIPASSVEPMIVSVSKTSGEVSKRSGTVESKTFSPRAFLAGANSLVGHMVLIEVWTEGDTGGAWGNEGLETNRLAVGQQYTDGMQLRVWGFLI